MLSTSIKISQRVLPSLIHRYLQLHIIDICVQEEHQLLHHGPVCAVSVDPVAGRSGAAPNRSWDLDPVDHGRCDPDVSGGRALVLFRRSHCVGRGSDHGGVPVARHGMAAAQGLPIPTDRHLSGPFQRPAGRRLPYHAIQDRAGVWRLDRARVHAGHAIAAELPARVAHR